MALPFRNFVLAITRLRCPFCLEGAVFNGWFNARRQCVECGYFGGSILIGYGVTILLALAVGVTLGYFLGMGWSLWVLAAVVLVTLIFPIWFFRYARVIWMCLDLYFNPPVREDFEPRGR